MNSRFAAAFLLLFACSSAASDSECPIDIRVMETPDGPGELRFELENESADTISVTSGSLPWISPGKITASLVTIRDHESIDRLFGIDDDFFDSKKEVVSVDAGKSIGGQIDLRDLFSLFGRTGAGAAAFFWRVELVLVDGRICRLGGWLDTEIPTHPRPDTK